MLHLDRNNYYGGECASKSKKLKLLFLASMMSILEFEMSILVNVVNVKPIGHLLRCDRHLQLNNKIPFVN